MKEQLIECLAMTSENLTKDVLEIAHRKLTISQSEGGSKEENEIFDLMEKVNVDYEYEIPMLLTLLNAGYRDVTFINTRNRTEQRAKETIPLVAFRAKNGEQAIEGLIDWDFNVELGKRWIKKYNSFVSI